MNNEIAAINDDDVAAVALAQVAAAHAEPLGDPDVDGVGLGESARGRNARGSGRTDGRGD